MNTKKECKQLSFKGQDFFIGIDVHKKSWKVTIRTSGRELKTFSMEPKVEVLYNHMQKNYPQGQYYSVYEAGFSGYWIHKKLVESNIKNIIVNPADIPTKRKERERKSDKIDSRKLARELENNSLDGIFIPTDEQLSIRSVSRGYSRIRSELVRIKQQIKSFLHFHGIPIPDKDEMSHWSGKFINYLRSIKFNNEAMNRAYELLLTDYERIRKERLEILKQMRKIVKDIKIIKYLQTIPGIGIIVSFILYAEIMDMLRFSSADKLSSYIGVVPSVAGSGDKEKVKGLTKRRNQHLRYLLIEAAWRAIKSDPVMTMLYSDYIKRMDTKRAIIKITRKLIKRIRYVWINEKPYQIGVIE